MGNDLTIDYEKITDRKSAYSAGLKKESVIDKHFIANPVLKAILENYTLLTNPELTGKYLEYYQNELKQDIIEYSIGETAEYGLLTLSKIAYSRLYKATNQYHLEKSYGKDGAKLEELRKKAIKYKHEYDIVDCLL